jgi:hypothetical protein
MKTLLSIPEKGSGALSEVKFAVQIAAPLMI